MKINNWCFDESAMTEKSASYRIILINLQFWKVGLEDHAKAWQVPLSQKSITPF